MHILLIHTHMLHDYIFFCFNESTGDCRIWEVLYQKIKQFKNRNKSEIKLRRTVLEKKNELI